MWPFNRREHRSSPENPAVSLVDAAQWASLFSGSWGSAAGVEVTHDTALGVPAVWDAVNFIAGTIASLPLHLFKDDGATRERETSGMLAGILAGTVNDDCVTSFKWRKGLMVSTLLRGRGLTYVERNLSGQVINLWPIEVDRTEVVRRDGRTLYRYRKADGTLITYQASEVIDVPFLLRGDGVGHYDPVAKLKETLGLAIALERYASRFFQNGGVPPLALSGPAASPGAAQRAQADIEAALRKAHKESKNILYMPVGHDLKPVGFDPEKGQLVEARRFQLEEIARIFALPPVFLQDLSRGTFSNTEQQDLHFVKHTLTQWVDLFEQELNAKLFGPRNSTRFVEFNLDGLLRGDFKTRMDGWAQGINTGQVTPNEARRAENRPALPGGDRLFIQGATVPLETQTAPAPASGGQNVV